MAHISVWSSALVVADVLDVGCHGYGMVRSGTETNREGLGKDHGLFIIDNQNFNYYDH